MARYQYIYVMQELGKTYPGGRQVLKGVTLSFLPGAKIGVIGVNGSGKSTLLKIMAGLDKEITGEAWAAQGIKIGYLPQEPDLDPNLNVIDNILEGVKETKQLLKHFEELSERFGHELTDEQMDALIKEQGEVQEKIESLNAWELDRTLQVAMDALRCPHPEANVTKLSGGERRRVALCRLLVQHPDILLLDEPTNHLDAESVAWLEQFLKEYSGTLVTVTHDRYFLDKVADWILELDRGQGYPFKGNYSAWLEQKQKRLEVEEKQETSRQKTLSREVEWIRQSPKARQAKSKARIFAYDELLQKSLEQRSITEQIVIPAGPRLGNVVIELENVAKGFKGLFLFENLTFKMPPGAIVGIVGANGAGKTTLFKLLTQAEQPEQGTVRIGESVKLGYIDQSRDSLNDNHTVWEEISGGFDEIELGKAKLPSRAYCARFNFKGTDQQKKVGQLSGGERNRVHLAKMLKSGANVLLLDEPTNDLDVETLRALEEALEDFAGCAIIISHDRWFLDRIATHILAFEGNGHVEWFEGNYKDYEADRLNRLGDQTKSLSKLRFKPLIRN